MAQKTMYWLTRDSINGVLSPNVEIWVRQPARFSGDDAVIWMDAENPERISWGKFRWNNRPRWHNWAVPETDIECIKHG